MELITKSPILGVSIWMFSYFSKQIHYLKEEAKKKDKTIEMLTNKLIDGLEKTTSLLGLAAEKYFRG